jgi:hypothetical protein
VLCRFFGIVFRLPNLWFNPIFKNLNNIFKVVEEKKCERTVGSSGVKTRNIIGDKTIRPIQFDPLYSGNSKVTNTAIGINSGPRFLLMDYFGIHDNSGL